MTSQTRVNNSDHSLVCRPSSHQASSRNYPISAERNQISFSIPCCFTNQGMIIGTQSISTSLIQTLMTLISCSATQPSPREWWILSCIQLKLSLTNLPVAKKLFAGPHPFTSLLPISNYPTKVWTTISKPASTLTHALLSCPATISGARSLSLPLLMSRRAC